jgi:cytochrome c
MKVQTIGAVAIVALLFAGRGLAADMPELAKKSGCSNCHKIDKKMVGPGWEDVAKKYKDDPEATAKLSEKISKGGKGVWGPVPMPANPKLTEAEVKELVTFILGLGK